MNARARTKHGARPGGFTLIEILVALVVLAILSVTAYYGLNQLMKAQEITQKHNKHFRRLQLAMATIGRDLKQANSRPVRLTTANWPPP